MNLRICCYHISNRDDLPLQGADCFRDVILETKKLCPSIKIEVLTPDFEGIHDLIDIVADCKS